MVFRYQGGTFRDAKIYNEKHRETRLRYYGQKWSAELMTIMTKKVMNLDDEIEAVDDHMATNSEILHNSEQHNKSENPQPYDVVQKY